MEDEEKINAFKKLLNRLQEDSWQLELLISGFAIFGLFSALDPISDKILSAQFDGNYIFSYTLFFVRFSLKILLFNLVIHVFLRGLWIGSLGFRYVFGDIEFDKLKYHPLFTDFLKKKIGSFDLFIRFLENVCSTIFALTFLLVFYICSTFMIICVLALFNSSSIPEWAHTPVFILFLVFSFGVVLTFVDFITQGLLKKKRILARIYYPFYRFFSILTLSFFYRPLLYNLLDNKLGRRIGKLMVPFYILVYIVFHFGYQKSNFVTESTLTKSNSFVANGRNYEDVFSTKDYLFIGDFAIQSKLVDEPFLKIMVPIKSQLEDSLIAFEPLLKPKKDERGLYFQSEISLNRSEMLDPVFNENYVKTFEKNYRFKIDSVLSETEFVVSAHSSKTMYFETYLSLKNVSEGKHTIEFLRTKKKGSKELISIREVPFWYFRN